jgi:hypothetical protein
MKNKYLVPVIFILLYNCKALAQSDLKNTGTLHIGSSSDTFFVAGSFTNSSAASFTNNGIVVIRSDLSNDQGGMNAGIGTLCLNGSSTQTISGSQPFKTYNLVSNNTAGFTLNNDISVSGTHTFLAGMVSTSATPNYMIYEAGSSYTGDSDAKHVNGWVKKIGSTDFTFPVGTATYERTVSLTNLTAAGEFNVRHNRSKTPYFTSLNDPLVLVDTAEYWTINKISGAGAKVTMNWDRSKVPFPLLMMSDIRATYYDGSLWKSIGGTASGNVSTIGSVISGGVSTFNANFTIGSVSSVLPLQILDFTANYSIGLAKIKWVTSNELNVSRYELQRSNDAMNFTTIALKYPFYHGNTSIYDHDDRVNLHGTIFYRLKIINSDNQVELSNIVTVSPGSNDINFYIMKNPIAGAIDIFAEASFKGRYNYSIIDNNGQLLQSGILEITNAGKQTILLRPGLLRGVYFLSVWNSEHLLQKSILKG